MPKIPYYSRDSDRPYPTWVHDITGDRIEIGPADQTEYRKDGNPKEYHVLLWARDGLNSKNLGQYSSKKDAKERAKQAARQNPSGQLVRTMREKRELFDYGMDKNHPIEMERLKEIESNEE